MNGPQPSDDGEIVAVSFDTGRAYFPAAYVNQLLAYIAQLEQALAELRLLAAGG